MAVDLPAGALAPNATITVATVTVALLAVMLFRRPVRGLFGARAAYCLWLIVPAMAVCLLLPRSPIPVPISVPALFEGAHQMPSPGVRAHWPLALFWALGTFAYGALLIGSHRRFLATLGSLRVEDRPDGRIFHAATVDHGPALVGGLFPRLIVPLDFATRFSTAEQDIVIAHERIHRRGGDAQVNLVILIVRALLWFHPLVHVAARLIRIDQELACDETVIARNPGWRRLYAEAMLKAQMRGTPFPIGCRWHAGNGSELRRRIIQLSRTPARWRRTMGILTAATFISAGGATIWSIQPIPAGTPATALKAFADTDQLLAARGGVALGYGPLASVPIRLVGSPDAVKPSPAVHARPSIIPGEAETPRRSPADPITQAMANGATIYVHTFDEEAAALRMVKAQARLQSDRGDLAGAAVTYGKALALWPHDVDLLASRGVVYAKAGDAARAERDFTHALASANSSNDLNQLCWKKATAGIALESALADCNLALAMDPYNPEYHDSRALVLLRLGRYDQAITDYDSALDSLAAPAMSRFGRAVARARNGDKAGSEADLAAALKADASMKANFEYYGITL